MRINKGICISVSNITFALIMILKMTRKRNEKICWLENRDKEREYEDDDKKNEKIRKKAMMKS